MRDANQPLSEIKRWEWEEMVWVYDEFIKACGTSTQGSSK